MNRRSIASPRLALGLFLAACAPIPDAPPSATPTPAGEPLAYTTVAQAPQADAPVIWDTDAGRVAAWIGSDAAGVHHDARHLNGSRNGSTLNPVVVLPLPPTYPYAQQGYPAGNGNLHLLWLDAANGANAASSDGNRLYSAVLTPDLTVRRGPTAISNAMTLRYDAIPDPNGAGGLWVAWSGGILSEPAVYIQRIDEDGRPRAAIRAAANADWPALARTRGGDLLLFWVDGATGQLARGQITGDAITNVATLASGITLAAGDRLESTSAATDSGAAYYFWNVTRANGERESWVASGGLSEPSWVAPVQLALPDGDLHWVAAPHQPADILPVVAEVDAMLTVVFLWGGQIVGAQPVAPLDAPGLVGLPRILVAENGDLTVAWSQPTETGRADLRLATVNGSRQR